MLIVLIAFMLLVVVLSSIKNRNVLKNYGITILLNASIETIIRRLENDSKKRPLFTNKNALENIWDEKNNIIINVPI